MLLTTCQTRCGHRGRESFGGPGADPVTCEEREGKNRRTTPHHTTPHHTSALNALNPSMVANMAGDVDAEVVPCDGVAQYLALFAHRATNSVSKTILKE